MKRPLSFLIVASFSFSYIFSQQGSVFDLSLEQLTRVRITSATLSEQRVQDAPGAISVITRQDIERMGFRTLRDVFATIPGFQILQNDDEMMVAVRGVYPTTNQKILVMRDGNPINEALLDRFEPGYLSLESVKKIEIIRGPSASLYGNSATTAVVNIITEDEDKVRIKVNGGNYGYLNADGVYSRKFSDRSHLLLFGRLSNTNGQRFSRALAEDNLGRSVRSGYAVVEDHPWNYDLGFRAKMGVVTAAASLRHSYQNIYWGGAGQIVRADSLLVQPYLRGLNMNSEVVFNPQFKQEKWKMHAQIYFNFGQIELIKAAAPDSAMSVGVFYPRGKMTNLAWNGLRVGGNGYAAYEYAKHGSLLLGMQIEQRQYLSSHYATNYLGPAGPDQPIDPNVMVRNDSLIPPSKEMRNAVYAQLQQGILGEKLKINLGARLDIPQNFEATLNPRVALIWTPREKLTLKGVYAKGFQAPGYLYRASVPALGSGSTDKLNSEIMHSVQAIGRYAFGKVGHVEVVGFWNQLSNLVTRNGTLYENLGKVVIRGVEVDSRFDFKQFALFGNVTYMVPDSAAMDSLYRTKDLKNGRLKHQSTLISMIGGTYRPSPQLSLYGQYFSGFYTGVYKSEIWNPAHFLVNGNFVYRNLLKKLDLSLSGYNLLNAKYKLGDRDTALLPQQGRWIQAGIAVHLQ